MNRYLRNTFLGIIAGTLMSTSIMAQNPSQPKNPPEKLESVIKDIRKDIRAANREKRIKSGNGTQFYFGGGTEIDLNSSLKNNPSKGLYDEKLWIEQFNAGLKIGKISFGGLFGYRNNLEKNIEEYYPSTYTDPNTGEIITIGGTTIKTNIKYKVMQPGLEVTFYPIKNLGLGLGVQYNIIDIDTTGTVYQTITDGAGNVNGKLTTLEEKTAKQEFFTLNPTIELKLNHFAIYVGEKYSLKPDYKNSISLNAGVKIYLGK